jgi:hypothetical protein
VSEVQHRCERGEQTPKPRKDVRIQKPHSGNLVERSIDGRMQKPTVRNSERGKNGKNYSWPFREPIASIELSTSSVQAVTKRFDLWRTALQAVIGIGYKEPRCFSRKLKEELFKADPTCLICSQRIVDVDDAVGDHIEQYWTGGKTIPEYARLAHRYCNWSRPRKD